MTCPKYIVISFDWTGSRTLKGVVMCGGGMFVMDITVEVDPKPSLETCRKLFIERVELDLQDPGLWAEVA